MSKELFPESDAKFAKSAGAFARFVEREPDKYRVAPERVREIVEAVRAYASAFAEHNDRYTRSMKTRIAKDRARSASGSCGRRPTASAPTAKSRTVRRSCSASRCARRS